MNRLVYLQILLGISCFSFSTLNLADQSSNGLQNFPAVACHYEMKVTPSAKSKAQSKNAWYFWRKPGMVQTMDADGDYGEIWEQTATGDIYYRKLYHGDKTAVEYMPADNPTNNLSFDWSKLSSMLSAKELESLTSGKKSTVLGHEAILKQGKVDGQAITVQWLVKENIPARIIRKSKDSTVELRLVSLEPLESAQRKPIGIETIANYRHIDAVDFGDMENDPFVKKIMAASGHHH